MLIIEPSVFRDRRGFFVESFHARKFAELGITAAFVQDNHSRSGRDTVRGLHYQLHYPQAKLCRVSRGEVLDVAVDIRRGSPAFGTVVTVLLSEENLHEVFLPRGVAHGFRVLSETADFHYKCDEFYHAEDEHGIAWDDPDLAIPWDVSSPLLSEKDRRHPRLAELPPELLPAFA